MLVTEGPLLLELAGSSLFSTTETLASLWERGHVTSSAPGNLSGSV
jgi:hypothetical protein